MASQAEREKARRYEIEKAYVKPEPRHDWADAAPSDRPSVTVDRIVAAARAKGWTVVEKTRLDWHEPKWVTVEGKPSEYRSAPRVQYHLYVKQGAINEYSVGPEGGLAMVNLLMIDGTKRWLKLGFIGRSIAETSTLSITSVAKLIAEQGVSA